MPGSSATVSIALAAFNGADFIAPLLQSLANQTTLPCEIVACDDGSSDNTMELLHDFAGRAPFPVRIFRNLERLGYAANFLKAASLCSGRYVAFCDQDDVWFPDKLQRCVDALESNGALLCGHEANIINERGEITGYHRAGVDGGLHEPLTLPPWYLFFGFTIVFHRCLLDAASPQDRTPDQIDPRNQLAHDRWLYLLGSGLGRTAYIPQPLVNYRQHGKNVFGTKGGATLPQKVFKLLTGYPSFVEKYALLSRARYNLFLRIQTERSNQHAAAAADAARYWLRIADYYELRVELAHARGLYARGSKIRRLASLGAYANFADQGLSRQALYEDLVAACVQFQPTTLRRAVKWFSSVAGERTPSSLSRLI